MGTDTAPMKKTSLGHFPGSDKWEFDASVTDVFDDMLERSIPQYHVMRDVTTKIGMEFVQPNTDIVDLGTSRGEALDPFMRRFGAQNRYVGVEVSEPMRAAFRERYKDWPSSIVRLLDTDLRRDYPFVDASLTLCVLTLLFVPINYRQRIMHKIAQHTRPGGAVILVEKLIGSNATTDELMVKHYHALKAANGYTQEEIDRKALALEGVQVPVTAEWNEDMLRAAGFTRIECIWRYLNFAAWVGIKA